MKTYKASFDPNRNKGVFAISLVEKPAMEGLFIALSKDTKIELKTIDEEKRILIGLVLEPEKPIYRNQNGEEFNIVFDADTIRDLSYSFFKNNNQKNSTIEHSGNEIEGVTFVESWIVEDTEKDKSSAFGFSYPKGSWIATMKVDNEEIWNDFVKTGSVKGFSIDAMLSLEEINLKSEIKMSKETETSLVQLLKDLPNQIAVAFGSKKAEEIEIKLGSLMVADGSVTIEYDGDTPQAGGSIWVVAEDGSRVPVPVGEYLMEDGTTFVVEQDGLLYEIRPMADQAAPVAAEEVTPQQTADSASKDADMAKEIESAIKSILIKYTEQAKEIEDLKEQVTQLSKEPASKGIKQPETKVDFNSMSALEKFRLKKQQFNG